MTLASTTLELEFVTNAIPRLFAFNPERNALAPLCVVHKTAGDVVHRFDAHRSLLRDDAHRVRTECLANIARHSATTTLASSLSTDRCASNPPMTSPRSQQHTAVLP